MASDDTVASGEPDVIRAVVPGVAVGVVLIAALSEPAGWIEFGFLVIAAAALTSQPTTARSASTA